jgi:RNA polymerase sigma factor (sigma-70 family)
MNDMMVLVEPLIPALRRYARSLLGNRDAADDLVQDCLERTVGRWHQRRADGDARTWVFTILHNLAVNSMRQKSRRGWHVPVQEVEEAAFANAPVQEDRLRHRDLLKALQDLPADQRAVLLLVSVEDLTYAEAARVLDIPIGTVMSRLARGREKLLRIMEGEAAINPARTNLRRVK